MKALLLKYKPKDQLADKFEESWENLGTSLEPLYEAIKELIPSEKITLEDLTNPNMLNKMVWIQAQRDLGQKILDLFPKNLTSV